MNESNVTSIAVLLPSTRPAPHAANESSFQMVPGFCLTAHPLREVVDQIADHAMAGVDQIALAIASAPMEVQPLLGSLLALFGAIGHAADATAADIGVDLDATWAAAVA